MGLTTNMDLKTLLLVTTGLAGCWSASLKQSQGLPIGTILSWNAKTKEDVLPPGWELCNGQVIEDESSPLFGKALPPLNTENLFLKGSELGNVGAVQKSSLPEHRHEALGHSHADSGHTHEDAGHTHQLEQTKMQFPVLQKGSSFGDGNGGPHWAQDGFYPPFEAEYSNALANIQEGHAQVSVGNSILSGVKNARQNENETRPKNVKIPFIMKIKETLPSTTLSVLTGWLPKSSLPENWRNVKSINDLGLFLRGGTLEELGEVQLDSMQDHSHLDAGHTHKDIGHTHTDKGHAHKIQLGDERTDEVLRPGDTWGDRDGGPHFGEPWDMGSKIGIGYADIQTSHADIEMAKAVIGSVTGAETGDETRPKNMRVVFVEGETDLSDANYFPVGTILPLMSTDQKISLLVGWAECDGSISGVPDLNKEGRFLRGGSLDQAGILEEALLQEHNHEDIGHTHADEGHAHVDAGHSPDPREYLVLIPGSAHGDRDGGPNFAKEGVIEVRVEEAKAKIATSSANLEVSKADVTGVFGAEVSNEVRPSNMGVTFIMRLF